MAAYDIDKPFFETIRRSFVNVPVDATKDNAISTTEFLEAADSLTTLFGTSSQQGIGAPSN
ncbi:MAG: hypothetical protein LQ347_006633 [Umbilicaria vellea]|nr:MAG: hypothetical protein LQ347_006633 [Umbilicaria vellea]